MTDKTERMTEDDIVTAERMLAAGYSMDNAAAALLTEVRALQEERDRALYQRDTCVAAALDEWYRTPNTDAMRNAQTPSAYNSAAVATLEARVSVLEAKVAEMQQPAPATCKFCDGEGE